MFSLLCYTTRYNQYKEIPQEWWKTQEVNPLVTGSHTVAVSERFSSSDEVFSSICYKMSTFLLTA